MRHDNGGARTWDNGAAGPEGEHILSGFIQERLLLFKYEDCNTCTHCTTYRTSNERLPDVIVPNTERRDRGRTSGFSIIVVARCSVSAWPEWRMLRAENDKTLGDFVFQDPLAIELQKRQDQLAQLNSRVFDARIKAAQKFERAHAATIRDYDFPPGSLALMRHTQIEKSLNRKMRPRYTGPLVVISRNRGGAYVLCELDGSVLHRAIAAFRLIPYLARGAIPLPANLADISSKRLSELIVSDDDGEDDPEPELIGEPVADLESDEEASSESSLDD
ncbi:hypothetical protein ACG7TL_006685 [Trametes sanguinea]